MRARLSVMFVGALVMVLTSLLSPAAFAQEQQQKQQRDPNEGEPKHEINELQNRLHQTEDKSKQNHIEGNIDALQDQRLEEQKRDIRKLRERMEAAGTMRASIYDWRDEWSSYDGRDERTRGGERRVFPSRFIDR